MEREKGQRLQERADATKKPSQLPAGPSDVKPSQLPADRPKDTSPRVEPLPATPSTWDAARGSKDFQSTDTHQQLQADRSARSRGDYRAASSPSSSHGSKGGGGGGRR